MSIIDDYKFKKSLDKAQIFITYDDKKRPVLYIGNGEKKVLIKQFFGISQYNRWLSEAVISYMTTNEKLKKNTHRIYNNIVKYLEKVDGYEDFKI